VTEKSAKVDPGEPFGSEPVDARTGPYCGACGLLLDEPDDLLADERPPCPSCRSVARLWKRAAHDSATMHESIGVVGREEPGPTGGKGRRFLEVKSGDFLSADGTWSRVVQVVDRRTKRYRKFVQREDGTVVRDVDEPLAQHQGYGSAKPRDVDPGHG
jgi:hypothetical protein